MSGLMLPAKGSNQESPRSNRDVLPVTPSGNDAAKIYNLLLYKSII